MCNEGQEVRLLSDDEKVVLSRLREVFCDDEQVEIPSLKSRDKWEVMKEVSFVNSLLSNILPSCNDVTIFNKLLYAGSYVVCERLGLIKKAPNLKSKKPW